MTAARGMKLRLATPADLDAVLPHIEAFYTDFGFAWDMGRKRGLLSELLAQPALGALWLIEQDGAVVGYALVTFYFSLEYDGRVALLDELYVTRAHRGAGVGHAALSELETELRHLGARVVRLEVDARHARAASLYARHGYNAGGREMWTRRLD